MDMQRLVERVIATPGCSVSQPMGVPVLRQGHVLPEDVRRFYELCGGMELYGSEWYGVRIPGPDGFLPADPVVLSFIFEEWVASGIYDSATRSRDWYIIADIGHGDYIVIDCDPGAGRLGRCYQALWDSGYPGKGNTPIIARSFGELLERVIEDKGDRWYFLQPGFEPYGDAYD